MYQLMSCAHALVNFKARRKIAAFCQVGQRGYLATRVLLQAGLSAVNISGGYQTYLLFNPRIG